MGEELQVLHCLLETQNIVFLASLIGPTLTAPLLVPCDRHVSHLLRKRGTCCHNDLVHSERQGSCHDPQRPCHLIIITTTTSSAHDLSSERDGKKKENGSSHEL